MGAFTTEKVTAIKHWTDTLFSFKTTRGKTLRFKNGHFIMIGLNVNSKPLLRAYSVVSPNYEEQLEFLSIKVPDGPLTSRLQHIKVGDDILIGEKAVGTLVIDDINPGKNLYLLSTGTGLAPFMSIIRDPETYDRFEKVILVHGVRQKAELAYREYIERELPNDELLAEIINGKLLYYPTVTREAFTHTGRITKALTDGSLSRDLNLPTINAASDRAMICGSPEMLNEISGILDNFGLTVSPSQGRLGDYVIERAFVGE